MRTIVLGFMALGLVSASPPELRSLKTVAELEGAVPDKLVSADEAICRDKIHQVRAAANLPRLDRGTAARREEGYLIAAVDTRIDGCSVMVMRNDTSDIRPLPKPGGNVGLVPAN
ncbi:MAG: hypothetical protein R3E14_14385 [Erythrobacter sp.]